MLKQDSKELLRELESELKVMRKSQMMIRKNKRRKLLKVATMRVRLSQRNHKASLKCQKKWLFERLFKPSRTDKINKNKTLKDLRFQNQSKRRSKSRMISSLHQVLMPKHSPGI
jgi:hypothetical protein